VNPCSTRPDTLLLPAPFWSRRWPGRARLSAYGDFPSPSALGCAGGAWLWSTSPRMSKAMNTPALAVGDPAVATSVTYQSQPAPMAGESYASPPDVPRVAKSGARGAADGPTGLDTQLIEHESYGAG